MDPRSLRLGTLTWVCVTVLLVPCSAGLLGAHPASPPAPALPPSSGSHAAPLPTSVRLREVNFHAMGPADTRPQSSGLYSPAVVLGSIPVGSDPTNLAFDARHGWVDVANYMSRNLSILNGLTLQGTVHTGLEPSSLLFDPNLGETYVSNVGSANVSLLNGTAVAASLPVGSEPGELALNGSSGNVTVTDFASNNVTILHGSSVARSFAVGSGPYSVVYDPSDQKTYVSDAGSAAVSIVSDVGVVKTLPLGVAPGAEIFDPVNGYVYVGGSGFLISAIAGTSLRASIAVPQFPEPVAIDPATGQVFSTTGFGNASVTVINGTQVLRNLSLGLSETNSGFQSLVFDPANGLGYVADYSHGEITAFNSTQVIGTVGVGTNPFALLLDPVHGYLYCANAGSNNVTVLAPAPRHYAVHFHESGLPNGTGWSVDLNGTRLSSSSPTIDALEPNGSAYPYAVHPVVGYAPTIPNGSFAVTGGAAYVEVGFAWNGSGAVPVWFNETGLGRGIGWTVTLTGTGNFAGGSSNSSAGASIGFGVVGGLTAEFRVNVSSDAGVPGYASYPDSGSLRIPSPGRPVAVAVIFSPALHPLYSVAFNETGLPTGATWEATLNATTHTSTGAALLFFEPNGTYTYRTNASPVGTSDFLGVPASGQVAVTGDPQVIGITFSRSYVVTFTASGLPGGTPWSVVIDRTTLATNRSSLEVPESNGSHAYSVGSVPGYVPVNGSGVVEVRGNPVVQPLEFRSQSAGSSSGFGGLSPAAFAALLVGSGAVAGGAIVWFLRRPRPAPGPPPP